MTEKTIYDRLADAQKSVKNPVSDATGKATATREYGYSTLANVLDIVRPACNAQGLFLSQRIGGKTDDMHIITSVACGSERLILDSFPLTYAANSQQFGSAVTYAKRYSLISVFGIASKDEDDDGSAGSKQQEKQPQNPKQQPRQHQNPQTKLKQDPANKALYDAAAKLKKAIADYAAATNGDAAKMHDGVKKRPDFENSAEFYLRVASEFEQETDSCTERMEF